MKLVLLSILTLASASVFAEPYFVHCFDFRCKSTQEVHYDEGQWQSIRQIFESGSLNSDQEKQAIRRAVALMENYSGEITGTSRDEGGNYSPGSDIIKQLDCIDESTNTFQYLSALQELDLLKWHKVEPKVRRTVWFAQHWTAVISDNTTSELYVVDSWYRDNGEPPYIQILADWKKKRKFPEELNPG
ncbi:MAG: hypothetical protein DRQ59_12880 [Gammaproteobacteria bacterium]|nr:MAG: hypothetical protein DRQ59_12880 [Gammaproteobacteria bacterium]